MTGTVELMKASEVVCKVLNQVGLIAEDKEFSLWGDFKYLMAIVSELKAVPEFSKEALTEELKDLTDEEGADLVAFTKANLSLPQEQLETKAEEVLDLVYAVLKALKAGKKVFGV